MFRVLRKHQGGLMKVDGIEVEWWEKDRFKNRTIEIVAPAGAGSTIDIPDDDILCDCCNSLITEFPVAVWECNAYCKACFEKYLKPYAEV